MNNNNQLISVIIPALNEEKYLPKCLESFKKQTYRNFELIVVDGGSTDKTIEVAKSYLAKVIAPHSANICQARQKGLETARGEILVGADADNTYSKDHLKIIMDNFEKNPDAVAVVSGGIFERKPVWTHYWWRFIYYIILNFYCLTGYVIYAPAFNISYKRNLFIKLGGYKTYLDYGGDELDVLSRLRKKGRVIFDPKLFSHASSRRMKQGIFKAFFLHGLFYYYLNYFLAQLFHKTVIKGKGVR